MPVKIAKLAKKMIFYSNSIIRDFSEITHIKKREGFINSMMRKLAMSFSTDFDEGILWFDGLDNFFNSIHMFSIVVYYQDEIVVLEPLLGNTYWTMANEFFINDLNANFSGSERIINSDVIPVSLGLCWKKANYIKDFVITDSHSKILIGDNESMEETLIAKLFPAQENTSNC